MKHPGTHALFAYWNALRGERTAPERSEIDPAEIRSVLADIFMLDVDMTEGFPFRLAGTRVNGMFDAELKSTSFVSLWRNEERRNIAAVLTTVADNACPVVAGGIAAPHGQEECALEFLFLPLRHFGRTHSRILGSVCAAQRPAWLGMLSAGPVSLRSLRMVDGSEVAADAAALKPILLDQVTAADQIEAPMTGSLIVASTTSGPKRPQLRVIQGGI